ncbi:Glycosyl hydrolases family 35 [Arthrobacter subterraneus]|uniref:Glycosyl hydrolases family 35 n=2 Tax=Arthrobacter subterraneus TaxID=335973 RepID=A0A1G8LYA9_9MICC|nr:Glycosyl hydrolases family 35 [Arthrobacter subterraneus]
MLRLGNALTVEVMPSPCRVTHRDWDTPETFPGMANDVDIRPGLSLTSRSIRRNGEPWIPVTGEMHYSRQPRDRWADALRLMKAGGITVVATYVFWIHHQPVENEEPDFSDNLDLAAFIMLCRETGLDVVLRLGPWCHGEVRNGGHPDWIVDADYPERTDHPRYLDAVRAWFGAIGRQLAGLCGNSGPVIGIQLENELYDQPGHILTLKSLAREAGLTAPLWTATAWGSADIPVGEVFPLYGGYADGFWVDTDQGWDESFQAHFTFSRQWDDPGIGRDLAGDSWTGTIGAKHPDFPAATCELGGGMATAYHRRPALTARDIAAVAHCKLGSGSVWQGYYMYVGGSNPRPGLQESHATGYPNDLPEFNYDFAAPIGAHLQVRESLHRLRNQHSFLEAFGSGLADMNTTLPDHDDDGGLRWALRSNGRSGFVFINNHRPYRPLPERAGVHFDITLGEEKLRFPHRPVTVPAGEFMSWPVQLEVGGVVVRWATLNVLTVIEPEEGPPVLVLTANDGVDAHLAVPAGYSAEGHPATQMGEELVLEDLQPGILTLTGEDGARLRVLTLSAAQALQAWTPSLEGKRCLVLSAAPVLESGSGLDVMASAAADVAVFPPLGTAGRDGFSRHPVTRPNRPVEVRVECVRAATQPPPATVRVPGRASAPTPGQLTRHSTRFRITVTGHAPADERSLLRLELVGDVASSLFEGRAEDVYWNGAVWEIDITPSEDTTFREVAVLVYPLTPGSPVWLPEAADRIRGDLPAPTAEITAASALSVPTVQLFPGRHSGCPDPLHNDRQLAYDRSFRSV